MIVVVILVIVAVVVVVVVVHLYNDPDWLGSSARAERDYHAVRRSREANELRHAIRRDAQRFRAELDDEFEEVELLDDDGEWQQ